jgi:hypothetical protein
VKIDENAITCALVMETLAPSAPAISHRFVSQVCGIAMEPSSSLEFRYQATWEKLHADRGVVVGLAPRQGLASGSRARVGAAVVDAVIAGDVLVLLEVKKVGQCNRDQLARHASHWALGIEQDASAWRVDELPAGVCLTNWKRVGGWLARELNRRQTSPDHERLQSLGTLPDSSDLDLIRLDTNIEPAPACDAVALERPPKPRPTAEIVSDCDLNRVRRVCRALYGTPGRNEHVSKADCAADAARVIADFERAKIEPSTRLRDQQAGGPVEFPRFGGHGLIRRQHLSWL